MEGNKSILQRGNWNNRIFNLFCTKAMYDVTFTVGENPFKKSFNVHKLILSLSSPFLHQLCYEKYKNEKIIELQSDDPDDFELMISCIYGHNIKILSVQQAWNLLNLSNKYDVLKLKSYCKKFILQSIDCHNACTIYEEASYLEEEDLILQSLKYIINNTNEIISKNGFKGAHPDTLAVILKQKFLNISSELQLLKAVLEWAKVEKSVRKKEALPLNLRKILDPLLYNINFLHLRMDEFLQQNILFEIFSKEEILSILKYMASKDPSNLPVWCNINKIRRNLKCNLEKSLTNLCICKNRNKSLNKIQCAFQVKENGFFLTGIGFLPSSGSSIFIKQISGTLSISTNEEVEISRFEKINCVNLSEQVVKFPEPILVKKKEKFEICLAMDEDSPNIHCCDEKTVPYLYNEFPFIIISSDSSW